MKNITFCIAALLCATPLIADEAKTASRLTGESTVSCSANCDGSQTTKTPTALGKGTETTKADGVIWDDTGVDITKAD